MARNRRSKEEVLQAKITKIDNELAKYNEKINSLTEECLMPKQKPSNRKKWQL